MTSPNLSYATFLAVFAIAAPVVAQGVDLEHKFVTDLGATLESVAIERVLPARLGDDTEMDVLVVGREGSQGRLFQIHGPTSRNTVAPIAANNSQIVGATVLRGAAGATRDPIVVLTTGGLTTYQAPARSAGGVDYHTPVVASTFTGGGSGDWIGATSVWSGCNADGDHVVLGPNANGSKIVRAKWSNGTLVSLPTLAVPSACRQLSTMDYDGVGEVEIVLVVGALAVVLDWNTAAVVAYYYLPTADTKVAVSRGEKAPAAHHLRDLLVCHGGGYLLATNGGYPMLSPLYFATSSFAASGMAAFEADHAPESRREDLVLASNSASEVLVLQRNSSAANLFTPQVRSLVVGVDRPSAPLAWVAAADFDDDGDGDVVALQSAATTESMLAQVLPGTASPLTRAWVSINDQLPTGNLTSFSLPSTVVLPPSYMALIEPTTETLWIQVVGWVRQNAQTAASLDGIVLLHQQVSPTLPTGVSLQLPAAAGLSLVHKQWAMDLQIRLVAVSGTSRRELPAVWAFASVDHDRFGVEQEAASIAVDGIKTVPEGTNGDRNLTGGTGSAGTGSRRP
ncbi:MAG: hypothetical protein JNK15_05680 [Planctomycetes bacterium]|nr:hypothetical protein [Planctomycetota bacterium]